MSEEEEVRPELPCADAQERSPPSLEQRIRNDLRNFGQAFCRYVVGEDGAVKTEYVSPLDVYLERNPEPQPTTPNGRTGQLRDELERPPLPPRRYSRSPSFKDSH